MAMITDLEQEQKPATSNARRGASVAPFDRRLTPSEQDVIDEWSKTRAERPNRERPTSEHRPNLLVTTTLANVRSAAVRWHWKGRIPVGKLCIVQGDPGVSKSLFTMYVTACLTTGRPFYGETARRSPCDVLILSFEDNASDTLKPRAQAAGADMERIHVVEGVQHAEHVVPLTLPDDLAELRRKIEDTGAGLLIVDPIGASIGGSIDTYVDASVRRMLAPLSQLAEESQCTILLVQHLGKSPRPAIHAGNGSIAFTGAARVVLAIGRSPENPETERVLATVKNNVSPHTKSLRYFISSWHGYAEASGEPFEAPSIEWIGESDATADDLIAARNAKLENRSEREEARDWLTGELKRGPQKAGDLLRDGVAMGYSKRTLQRVSKQDLKVERSREGERGSWLWQLPTALPRVK